MKFALVALIASASALKIRDDKPATARTYNEFSERVPNLPGFNNDEVLATEMVQIGDVKNNYYKGGWKETHIPAPDNIHDSSSVFLIHIQLASSVFFPFFLLRTVKYTSPGYYLEQ